MQSETKISLNAPYLIFIGEFDDHTAKTGLGLVHWCPELVAGQLRFAGNQLDLGVPDMSIEQAIAAGVKTMVVGVAPPGGVVDTRWNGVLASAAEAGLDIVSGLHTPLEEMDGVAEAAARSNVRLLNVRKAPSPLPIGKGEKRRGRRVLMVGTDCGVGKKYTALALTASLKHHGCNATFRATGQTGIMIAGTGIPIDAVVADFIAGAAEQVSPENEPDHWDVIEGQGSLFHPSFAGVSLGLLHGSQPDAIVVCHDAARQVVNRCPHIPLPSIRDCIDLNLRCARLTNADVICAGVSVNTSGLAAGKREPYLQALTTETGLPCVDSMITGCDALTANIQTHFYPALQFDPMSPAHRNA